VLIKVFFSISERKILEEMRELKLLKNKFVSLSWIQSLVQSTCKRHRYYLKHMRLPGRHLFDVNNITRHRKLVIHKEKVQILKPNNFKFINKDLQTLL
jgi:hypothetical protein